MGNNINPISGFSNIQLDKNKKNSGENSSVNFADEFNKALNQLENDMKAADELSKQVASGEVTDLHQVMVTMEKSSISLQMAVQVRNKVVEAYQEIMRMQV